MSTLERIQPPVFPFDAKILNQVKSVQLNNGIPVFLIEAGTEDVMRIEIVFRAGAAREYFPLLASSSNMMLTEGSENYSSEELNRILDYNGIFLNPSSEKDTAGIVVYFLSKQIDKVLELAAEILFRPVFPDKELALLMKKRLRWYQVNREKVQNLAMDQFFESVFGSYHPYGRQVAENDFGNITPSILKDFHSKYYTPENMAVIVSGRIHERTVDLLNTYFGELHSKKIYIEETESHIKGDRQKKVTVEKPGAVQAAIRIGSSTIVKTHPDYPGLKFLNTILGGYFGSRLMKNIREEKGLTYGIHSGISSFELSGFKVISTEVGTKNTRIAIDEIYKEIRLLQTEPVKPDELEVVRKYMSGELVRMFDGPFALAESFKAVWEFGLDYTYYQRLAETIKTITSDKIIRLAETYYNIDDLYEIIAG
jgi:predicted Zn-dependent peptidase